MVRFFAFIVIWLLSFNLFAAEVVPTAGLHLVTYQSWGFTVDSTAQGQRVRNIINEAKRLGFKTIIFNFRGHMITGVGANIRSTVPLSEQPTEEHLLLETAQYAKNLGLQVAFRPILLVVGPNGSFPYVEKGKYWWHGNIMPKNPQAWFEAYYKFHERYMKLAQQAEVEWYSIGAEMHSMTSGLGDREPKFRLGYPELWVQFIQKARAIIGSQTRITYGINYTDQYVLENGKQLWGGELEQWRFYMTENFKKPEYIRHQKNLQALWSALDLIGIDYYRAFAGRRDSFSTNFETLVSQIEGRPKSHATQLDNTLTEIAMTLGLEKPLYFQEAGYRSVEKCFLDPATYEEDGGKLNPMHQAAAWEAFMRAYWAPKWPWMTGVGVWQVLVDEDIRVVGDKGFTPLGKPMMESVLKKYLK